MTRFLGWLFPALYSETAECLLCGDTVSKCRMYHDNAYGWFCNEDEYREFWNYNQT